MTTQGPQTPRRGLIAEAKDAITPRAFLLVVGIGLIQLAFIASYVGAFHAPTPHQVPMSVTAPATRVVTELNALPNRPLNATLVPDPSVGLAKLRDRSSYGLLEVSLTSTTDRLTVASAASTSTTQAVTRSFRRSRQRPAARWSCGTSSHRPPVTSTGCRRSTSRSAG